MQALHRSNKQKGINMRKNFDFYGYNSPTSGKFTVNDCEYFYAEDFRTKKRFAEYKNVGFTILLLQHENSYNGEEFIGSACHKCMTEAYKAGIKKIIVSDQRLKDLCVEKNILGLDGKFKDEKELLEYVKDCISAYKDMRGFYGVQLYDEPKWWALKSYGIVCRALKKAMPSIYLQCNLNPLGPLSFFTGNEKADLYEAYESYLNTFLDETGLDYILYDEYPFRRDYIIYGLTMRTLQIVSKVCKERGVELRMVLQSFAGTGDGKLLYRRVNERDMYWQTNLALGFGCKEFSFFTYFTKPKLRVENGFTTDAIDGAAMINRDGTRAKLYYDTKKIISEMKAFAHVILPYRFDSAYFIYARGKSQKDFMQTEYAQESEKCPLEMEVSEGLGLVTLLKKENSSLFMVENIGNVRDESMGKEKMRVCIRLPENVKKTKIYSRGKKMKSKPQSGKLSFELPCGQAIFIELKE